MVVRGQKGTLREASSWRWLPPPGLLRGRTSDPAGAGRGARGDRGGRPEQASPVGRLTLSASSLPRITERMGWI